MRRYKITRIALIAWCLFIGLGAVSGAVGMLSAPDGSVLQMQDLLVYFQVLPFADVLFQDYTFSGIALLLVNGIPNLIAAYLLLARKRLGIVLGGVFGFTLMLWITIQFIIFPANPLSISYFIFGVIQALTGYACYVFYRQSHEAFSPDDFPNVGKNPQRLVVYFSRLGRARLAAYREANRTGARVFELTTREPTQGTPGFWWCGRFGLAQMPMTVCEMPPLAPDTRLTVVTPVWVNGMCAPVRDFLARAKGRVTHVEYVLVHFQPFRYARVASRMDALLGTKNEGVRSVRAPLGHIKDM